MVPSGTLVHNVYRYQRSQLVLECNTVTHKAFLDEDAMVHAEAHVYIMAQRSGRACSSTLALTGMDVYDTHVGSRRRRHDHSVCIVMPAFSAANWRRL